MRAFFKHHGRLAFPAACMVHMSKFSSLAGIFNSLTLSRLMILSILHADDDNLPPENHGHQTRDPGVVCRLIV
ncbi:hypothetical protein BJX62DRAFT_209699 [Aspergillus germanicus]